LLSMLLAETTNPVSDIGISNGQLMASAVAVILGAPASVKLFDVLGKFVSRRFDNRDDLFRQMIEAQGKEMEIRLAEAKSRTAIAEALERSANAHLAASESIVKLAEALEKKH
jgi:hypothetical protein